MEQNNVKPKYKISLLSLVFSLVLFLVGVHVGFQNRPIAEKIVGVTNKESELVDSTDFAPFWKAWQVAQEKLPDSEKTAYNDLIYGAIKGMLGAFDDPYTTFLDPEEKVSFDTEIKGSFVGVGVELGKKEGILTVVAPLKNTPAYVAGILSGDKIIKIDDTITAGISVDDAVKKIRGEIGTEVNLTIFREGFDQPKSFVITRNTIDIPTVHTDIKDDVFIISLYNFSAQATSQFKSAFSEYRASGKQKLLLDLRGNPGGYVSAAVQIASLFVPEGEIIVREIGKGERSTIVHTSVGPDSFPENNQLIILVDGGSASSSEILAGALSEHGVGKLVGTETFGKGSVQEVVSITPSTAMKVTVAKWYTPNGVSISENGLTPSIVIPHDANAEGDTQLEKALQLFN